MKRIFALILVVCMLAGCQLASEKTPEDRIQDKLVGVFITFEYLDADFDFEGWLKDNPGAISDGETKLDFAESMAYSERIPVLMGEVEWIVPGYSGMSMAHYYNGEYWASFSTEGLCDIKSRLIAGETADTIEEEATIYLPMDAEAMIHCNPVYETAAGEYYTVPAMGLGGAVSTGGMSQSISEETVWKIDGQERSCSTKFTVAVQGITLAEGVTVVQMDAGDKELARAEFIPGQMPESITPEKDAAYLIVEEICGGALTRSLFQPGDERITVYYRGGHIWCLPEAMEIQWNE